jgi:cytochrome c553
MTQSAHEERQSDSTPSKPPPWVRHILATRTAHLVQAGLDISQPLEESVCPCCQEQRFDVRKRRRNTAYVNEESNWLICCGECHESDVEDYAELWDTYYHG